MASLKDMQETRLTLEKQIKDHADLVSNVKTEEETGEWKGTWDKLNDAYDENMSVLEAENASVKQQNDVSNRLEAISNQGKSFQLSGNLGHDGGSLGSPPQSGQFDTQPGAGTAMDLALTGWVMNNTRGMKKHITDHHHNAAKMVGSSLDEDEFEFALNSSGDFSKVQAHRLAQPQNALGVGKVSEGGALTGSSLVGSVEQAILDHSGVMQVADVIRTITGDELRWPTTNDTANSGRQIGEQKAVASLDPTWASTIFYAHGFTSDEVLVSRTILEDSIINLPAVLGEMLGVRLARILNTRFTTGTGAGQPRGIVTGAVTGVTAASATAIAYDEIIDLEHALDPGLRMGASYMMHDNIVQVLRKLKDGEGRYLWQANANSGTPDTINNRPFVTNADMQSSVATATDTILFGNMSKYKVRQVNSVRFERLRERHAENDQDAFLAFLRADGGILNAGDDPIQKLTQA